jgi:hypothetical protein
MCSGLFVSENLLLRSVALSDMMMIAHLPRSKGLLGVARANAAVNVSPKPFLLLLLHVFSAWQLVC